MYESITWTWKILITTKQYRMKTMSAPLSLANPAIQLEKQEKLVRQGVWEVLYKKVYTQTSKGIRCNMTFPKIFSWKMMKDCNLCRQRIPP